jgi:hypothetical protein
LSGVYLCGCFLPDDDDDHYGDDDMHTMQNGNTNGMMPPTLSNAEPEPELEPEASDVDQKNKAVPPPARPPGFQMFEFGTPQTVAPPSDTAVSETLEDDQGTLPVPGVDQLQEPEQPYEEQPNEETVVAPSPASALVVPTLDSDVPLPDSQHSTTVMDESPRHVPVPQPNLGFVTPAPQRHVQHEPDAHLFDDPAIDQKSSAIKQGKHRFEQALTPSRSHRDNTPLADAEIANARDAKVEMLVDEFMRDAEEVADYSASVVMRYKAALADTKQKNQALTSNNQTLQKKVRDLKDEMKRVKEVHNELVSNTTANIQDSTASSSGSCASSLCVWLIVLPLVVGLNLLLLGAIVSNQQNGQEIPLLSPAIETITAALWGDQATFGAQNGIHICQLGDCGSLDDGSTASTRLQEFDSLHWDYGDPVKSEAYHSTRELFDHTCIAKVKACDRLAKLQAENDLLKQDAENSMDLFDDFVVNAVGNGTIENPQLLKHLEFLQSKHSPASSSGTVFPTAHQPSGVAALNFASIVENPSVTGVSTLLAMVVGDLLLLHLMMPRNRCLIILAALLWIGAGAFGLIWQNIVLCALCAVNALLAVIYAIVPSLSRCCYVGFNIQV